MTSPLRWQPAKQWVSDALINFSIKIVSDLSLPRVFGSSKNLSWICKRTFWSLMPTWQVHQVMKGEWIVDCQQVLELLCINAGDCRVAFEITAGLVGTKVQLINRVNFHWLATSMQAWMITGLVLLASKLIVHCSESLAMQWGAGICFEWWPDANAKTACLLLIKW